MLSRQMPVPSLHMATTWDHGKMDYEEFTKDDKLADGENNAVIKEH